MQWITNLNYRPLLGVLLTAGTVSACGPAGLGARLPMTGGVRLATVDDPAPVATATDYYPLHLGQAWHYGVVGQTAAPTRTDTVVTLAARPNRDGNGMMTVAEIERTESGKAKVRFTVERYPNGLVRSYDPSLPKLGTPILAAPADSPQEWGYNPTHGQTGYFGIVQWPGTVSVTANGTTYGDCLKVVLHTSGTGFTACQREYDWAAGIGPVRLVEGGAARPTRILELRDDTGR